MADVGTHHFIHSSAKSDRVLVPQPSQDKHDPLVSFPGLATARCLIALYFPELEPLLEDEHYSNLYGNLLQSRPRTFGSSTHVPSVNAGIQFRPSWRRPVHWYLYSSAGFQQFLLVR